MDCVQLLHYVWDINRLIMDHFRVCRTQDGLWKWYKFDDGDVSECRMDDDEELKNQCFGGDYSGEVNNY